jgi:hypothetical protein
VDDELEELGLLGTLLAGPLAIAVWMLMLAALGLALVRSTKSDVT